MADMVGPYTVRTYGGNYLSFAEPKVEDIELEDIARALSRAPRFGGHTRPFYSVAQHALMASLYAQTKLGGTPLQALQVLHHDDSEAYIADMPTPAKRLMPDYYKLEKRLQDVINLKFNLPENSQHAEMVEKADRAMLFMERDEMIDDQVRWSNEDQHPGITMREFAPWWVPMDSDTAMDHFLQRHESLMQQQTLYLARAA